MRPTPAWNPDLLRLLAGLAAVVAATLVHDAMALAAALAGALALSGPGRGALLRRALRRVLPLALMLSAGLLLGGLWLGTLDSGALLRLNLRLALLSLLVAWTARAVDYDRALALWPAARRGLAVVRVQIASLQRAQVDYQAALRSRSPDPPSLRTHTRAVALHGLGLLDKAVHNAEAVTLGMRSRGALDG